MEIDKLLIEKKYETAISQCELYPHVALLLRYALRLKPQEDCITIKLLCNWTSSKELRNDWNKMTKGNFTWNKIKVIHEGESDYYIVINSTQEKTDPKKTILFRMEPNMEKDKRWGDWSSPNLEKFLKIYDHRTEYNNVEWHLGCTYSQLMNTKIEKTSTLSTILSSKYKDPGQIKRIDFVKFLEKKGVGIDVYGDNKWNYKNYKGSLPYHSKEKGLFPYKYTFNCENNSIKNYFTEKIVDGILSECLVFYSGCYNLRDFIDKRAFIHLELSNFESDYQIVKKAIEDNEWEKRIGIIRQEKQKILNHLQFFPRIEALLTAQSRD